MLDTKDIGERDGFDLRVEVHQDTYVKPEDFDTYDRETIEAFARDEWEFVMLRTVASKRGITLGEAWIGSVERGWFPTDEAGPTTARFVDPLNPDNYGYQGEYIEDMIGEALELAKSELAALAA